MRRGGPVPAGAPGSDSQAPAIPADIRAATHAVVQAWDIQVVQALAIRVVAQVSAIRVAAQASGTQVVIRAAAIRADPVILRPETLPTTIVARRPPVVGALSR